MVITRDLWRKQSKKTPWWKHYCPCACFHNTDETSTENPCYVSAALNLTTNSCNYVSGENLCVQNQGVDLPYEIKKNTRI